jgi:hypothetical protein
VPLATSSPATRNDHTSGAQTTRTPPSAGSAGLSIRSSFTPLSPLDVGPGLASDTGVSQRVASGLRPDAPSMRAAAYRNLPHHDAVDGGQHGDDVVVAAREPSLGAIGGELAMSGIPPLEMCPLMIGDAVGVEYADAAFSAVGDGQSLPVAGQVKFAHASDLFGLSTSFAVLLDLATQEQIRDHSGGWFGHKLRHGR